MSNKLTISTEEQEQNMKSDIKHGIMLLVLGIISIIIILFFIWEVLLPDLMKMTG